MLSVQTPISFILSANSSDVPKALLIPSTFRFRRGCALPLRPAPVMYELSKALAEAHLLFWGAPLRYPIRYYILVQEFRRI